MVSARQALSLLTFAVALMAITPALSETKGAGFPIMSPLECWMTIDSEEGCSDQLLKSSKELNFKFLPDCCNAIIGIPLTCTQWIFPSSLSFGDKVNKFCTTLLSAVPPRDS